MPHCFCNNFHKASDNLKIDENALYYKTQNIELRVKLGDPGKRGVNRGNYTRGRSDLPIGLDTINSLYLYKSNAVTTDSRKNDLVKFRIAVINNDNPKQKTFAHFRAFINSFSDNSAASWDSFKYLGRGEDFYNYNGFSNDTNTIKNGNSTTN